MLDFFVKCGIINTVSLLVSSESGPRVRSLVIIREVFVWQERAVQLSAYMK